MNQNRICPVCENEIPEDARFVCSHCHFELKWLDDEIAIQKARQNYSGELFTTKKGPAVEHPIKPAYEKIILNEKFSKTFSKTIFLVCNISLNFAILFALFRYYRPGEFLISGILLGIFYSIFFSKSTFQKIFKPIIWIIVLGFCGLVVLIWIDVIAGYHPENWLTFIGCVLGLGQSLIFFRNTNVGFWPAASTPLGMLAAGSYLFDVGPRLYDCSIEELMTASILFAVVATLPFIYYLINPSKKRS